MIKLPSTDADEAGAFVLHPGVLSYGDGEVKTFFDKYGDWFYLGLFLASGLGSAGAALVSSINAQRRRKLMSRVFEIEGLIARADAAQSPEELAEIERSMGEIFQTALKQAVHGDLDEAGIKTFEMALAEARNRIERRRQALAPIPAPPLPAQPAAGEPAQLIPFSSAGGQGS
jgi:hypothetical protein